MKKFLLKIFNLYYEGFRGMTVGKKLWIIILIKLFIMFVVLKLFFFHDFLGTNFDSDKDRANYVLKQLTR